MEYLKDPAAIYERSFATIRRETDLAQLPESLKAIAVRMVHACGMPDIVDALRFDERVVEEKLAVFARLGEQHASAALHWMRKVRKLFDGLRSKIKRERLVDEGLFREVVRLGTGVATKSEQLGSVENEDLAVPSPPLKRH